MIADNTAVIILAAGKGRRMHSSKAKVLHPLAGRPLISWVLQTAAKLVDRNIVVVVGNQADQVKKCVSESADVMFAYQEAQRGTGHAVQCALPVLDAGIENVLILCGDVPLISEKTLTGLLSLHAQADNAVTLLTVQLDNPDGYGRVITNTGGRVERIVEEADATAAEKEISTINSGIYCVRRSFLDNAVHRLRADNAQAEIYLTDIIEIACRAAEPVGMMVAERPTELLGVNTPEDLIWVESLLSIT
ncbi:MAG: NTP transferase domain-containing protein [Desulfosalsimonadaceae bacterium]